MRTRLVSILALFVVVLAACGSGDNKSSTTTTSPSTSTSAATATSAGTDPAAHARAAKLVLTQADMPPGWTSTPGTPDTPEEKAEFNQFAQCAGISGDTGHAAEVDGNKFNMGPGSEVESQGIVVRDEATYRRDVQGYKSSKVASCLRDFLSKAITKEVGSAPTGFEVTSISVPSVGDFTNGIRVKFGLTVQGNAITAFIDLILMGKNRAESNATFLQVGQPFDNALETQLINKLGSKLNAS